MISQIRVQSRGKQKESTGVLLMRLVFKIQQIVSCSPATLFKRNSFTVFFSKILLNFQVISHDIAEIENTYQIQYLLMASLFGFKRILGVDRSSRLEVFFKIPQNSKENICIGVSFLIKLQPAGLQLYQERRSNKFVFL